MKNKKLLPLFEDYTPGEGVWTVGIYDKDGNHPSGTDAVKSIIKKLGEVSDDQLAEVEPEDEENGVWMVPLPTKLAQKVADADYGEFKSGKWTVTVEMP